MRPSTGARRGDAGPRRQRHWGHGRGSGASRDSRGCGAATLAAQWGAARKQSFRPPRGAVHACAAHSVVRFVFPRCGEFLRPVSAGYASCLVAPERAGGEEGRNFDDTNASWSLYRARCSCLTPHEEPAPKFRKSLCLVLFFFPRKHRARNIGVGARGARNPMTSTRQGRVTVQIKVVFLSFYFSTGLSLLWHMSLAMFLLGA